MTEDRLISIYIYIITYPSQNTLLNKKSEILSKCRHENKHLLSHFNPFT